MSKIRLLPHGIQSRLLLTLILASLLPLAIGGTVFFSLVNQTISEENFTKAASARDAKAGQIRQYMDFARRQAASMSQTNNVRYAVGEFYGFSYAINQMGPDTDASVRRLRQLFGIDPTPGASAPRSEDQLLREALEYANSHRRFHDGFKEFLAASEFDNLYLVNIDGRVVYSPVKDAYFGQPLPERETMLSGAYGAAMQAQAGVPVFLDFGLDDQTGGFAAYIAVKIELYRNANAAMILRLPADGLARLLADRNAMSLISSRRQVIASTEIEGVLETGADVALPDELLIANGVSTLDRGLIGMPTLSAWSTLAAPSGDWLLVAEIDEKTAFAASRSLRSVILGLGGGAALILALLSFWLSRSMTNPAKSLTRAAEAVAGGALDHAMPAYDSPGEYARLSRAMASMSGELRRQLDLIRDKNSELECHLAEIEDKNAALEEADRMKDQFLANTSHELRTPLNGIIGISETLSAGAMGEFAPAQRSQLDLIALSARRLSRLVDDLLDLYRIREGRMQLDMQPIDVAASARNVLQFTAPILKGEPIIVKVDIPETTPPVQADPVRFEQILYNLVGNAIKFAGDGQIEIGARTVDRDGQTSVAVTVTDTGAGITPEHLDRIFRPLEQEGYAGLSPRRKDGAGLGLAIAQNLTQLMAGQIAVKSEVGKGTEFTLTFPAASGRPDRFDSATRVPLGLHETINAFDSVAPVTPRPDETTAPKILLVDDEPINLQVLRNVLVPRGYRVVEAENGTDALARVAEDTPDLIVLDVMMDGLSGLDVTRQLRRQFSLLELPIILLTARSRVRDIVAGFEVGANDYVTKPFVKDELLSRISTLLQASRAKQKGEENLDLKAEIERRIRIEDALRLTQRRTGQLLEALDDGLICVSPKGKVSFANPAASALLGKRIVAGQTLASDILPPEAMRSPIGPAGSDDIRAPIEMTRDGHVLAVNVFDLLPEAGGGIAVLVSHAERTNDRLVSSVRDAVDSSLSVLTGTGEAEDAQVYRDRIVGVMNDSLALWKAMTGRGKIEFAETSGLWRVSLDKTSLQTRTLDKYLLVETLPDNPRWRDVLRTGEWVLDQGQDDARAPEEAAAIASRLKQTLSDLRKVVPGA